MIAALPIIRFICKVFNILLPNDLLCGCNRMCQTMKKVLVHFLFSFDVMESRIKNIKSPFVLRSGKIYVELFLYSMK